MPIMINKPASTSILEMRRLWINGSISAVNSVTDDRHTSVTDTVDILIDSKNSTQCSPTTPPVQKKRMKSLLFTANERPVKRKKIARDRKAINTRYQTK